MANYCKLVSLTLSLKFLTEKISLVLPAKMQVVTIQSCPLQSLKPNRNHKNSTSEAFKQSLLNNLKVSKTYNATEF